MGSSEENVRVSEPNSEVNTVVNEVCGEISENDATISTDTNASLVNVSGQSVSETSTSKDETVNVGGSKKSKKKFRHGHGKKDNTDRSTIRRVHYTATKFKQGRKRAQSFPTISKFFLPHKRPRKDVFIPPTKFLLGGNISDPLNLNSLQDEDINRAMNAVTPESSPLPTPPRHKAKIEVIIPPNIRDPLNLMEPVDNDEYEKRLEMQQRKPRKKPKLRRRTTDNTELPTKEVVAVKDEGIKEPPPPEPSSSKSRKRSCSDSDNSSQKGKEGKKLRRMDSLDKIVSPVVPQPGSWKRARPQPRVVAAERPTSPRTKLKTQTEGEQKLPTFNPKNSKYQYGNYDRYYGYRNLNAMMDVRLQVFEMHRHLFQNKDVLDIGCNVGHVTIAVARNLGARSVVGIDIDPALIGRARRHLQTFVPVPEVPKIEEKKPEDQEKKADCDKCKEGNCEECPPKKADDVKKIPGRKLRRPRKNRKSMHRQEQGQCFFPMSMSMLYGPLCDPATLLPPPTFPYNVTFKQGNYVPREDLTVGSGDSPQFDLILCLSTTKWLHLNWGDAGLKRAFRRMFADLRPGGKLVLEAQNWASYKKKKRLTQTIYENFNSIEMLPSKFRDYLLSPEVGFSKCCILGVPQHASKGFRRPIQLYIKSAPGYTSKFRDYLLSPEVGFSKCCIIGVPQHASKGFRRPIQLYIKGDFTPSKARWSDAYAPSSHHRPEAEPPRRTVYAPVAPAYRPSDEPSCGAATPYSPNLDCCADDSPFYNPRSDSYAPSYQPPRPTVYATLPSPRAQASPAPSPAQSPAPHASPAPDPFSARGFPEPRED